MDAQETVNIQHAQINFKGKIIANRAAFPYIFFVLNMCIVIYGTYKLIRTFSEVECKDRERRKREEMEGNVEDLPSRSRTPGSWNRETSDLLRAKTPEFDNSTGINEEFRADVKERRNTLEVPL